MPKLQNRAISRPLRRLYTPKYSLLQTCALKIPAPDDLVGLGAYHDMTEGFMVYVYYIESSPNSHPMLAQKRKYCGIGVALLVYRV